MDAHSDAPIGLLMDLNTSLSASISGTPAVLALDDLDDLVDGLESSEVARFVEVLGTVMEQAQARLIAVTVGRPDDDAVHSGLRALCGAPWELRPLGEPSIREVIESSARAAGVTLEPGLTDRLLAEGHDAPVALVQAALAELWRQRRRGYLTHDAFTELGGIREMFAHRAKAAYLSLPENSRDAARSLLLRMVASAPDGSHVLRRVMLDDLVNPDVVVPDVILAPFVARQVISQEESDSGPRFRLAHESLLTSWPRLRQWIVEARDAIEARTELTLLIRTWERSDRTPDDLPAGPLLADLLERLGDLPPSSAEDRFVADVRQTRRRQAWGSFLTTVWYLAIFAGTAIGFNVLTDDRRNWTLYGFIAAVALTTLARNAWTARRSQQQTRRSESE